jgi:hypothetical protein
MITMSWVYIIIKQIIQKYFPEKQQQHILPRGLSKFPVLEISGCRSFVKYLV